MEFRYYKFYFEIKDIENMFFKYNNSTLTKKIFNFLIIFPGIISNILFYNGRLTFVSQNLVVLNLLIFIFDTDDYTYLVNLINLFIFFLLNSINRNNYNKFFLIFDTFGIQPLSYKQQFDY